MPTTPDHHRTPGPQYLVAGRYRLRSRIGGGGMGTVWLARDQLFDRDVAVKQVVSTEGLSEETAENIRQRAMREGRIAAKLVHRNAIAMHDVALDSGEPWLVMEYLPSRSVAQILHTTKTLDVRQAAQIGAQVADAMATAHTAGIIHRDIKPGNLLVTTTGRTAGLVKITDFGISRLKDEVSLHGSGVITGTPAYFAPEVARGAEPTEASDVYSLGATVYTLVEGQPPFGVDDDSLALLHKVARARINPMTRAGAVEPVLLRLLEPSPSRRPTMAQARDLLAEVAAGERGSVRHVLTSPITTPDGGLPTWAQRSPRPPRTHPTGTHLPVGGPLPARPPAASPHADDRVSAVSTATESGTHQPSDRTGLGRSGPSGLSPTMLAVGIGAVLALIVVVVLILVVAG
ncbi:serine/threonine-protein kinase [Gordonia aquimaris]|uniref:non-specific serine/threonine protein kinase n=1 Tax=Gordonia aquimaris TaxID=2984863 RepID=A0A9X3I2E1_9ACTN|nr:serine/threonine-protein kinase [Gordonia aquimaris]MCX2962502.1 protein kinase [Gordonia aquimaris]